MNDRTKLQSLAALVAFSSDWQLTQVSDNSGALLGFDLTAQIGADMDDLFPSATSHNLRSRAQVINHDTTAARVFALEPYQDGRLFDVTVHAHDAGYYFEFMPAAAPNPVRDETALVLRLVRRMRRATTQREVLREAVRGFRMLCGFRQAAILQQEAGTVGQVKACDMGRPIEGTDITPGARVDLVRVAGRLSNVAPLHLVSDAEDVGTRLYPSGNGGQFSAAICCYPLPEHLEWMRQADIRASLTVLVPGSGGARMVFVAHDTGPQHADQHRRSAIELFAEFVGDELVRIDLQEKLANLTLPTAQSGTPAFAREDQRPFLRLVENQLVNKALVVDDDLLISMDTADIVKRAGVRRVETAMTVAQARTLMAKNRFDFAILDVHLENGTSEVLARDLAARRLPFALLTGLSASDPLLEAFPKAPMLQKPLDLEALRAVMTDLGLPIVTSDSHVSGNNL